MSKKEEKLVAIEMTEQQKKDFVAFQLKQEKQKEDEESNTGFVEINLFTKHSFGRRTYGPGKSKIPAGLAGQIVYQDQRAMGREISLNTSNKKLVQILQSGQQINIPQK